MHVNFNYIGSPPAGTEPEALNEKEKTMVERGQEFMRTGSGCKFVHFSQLVKH